LVAECFERDAYCLFGLLLDAVDTEAAVRIIRQSIADRRPCFLSTPNLNWLVAVQSDTALLRSVAISNLSIADGMPLVVVCRMLGIPIRRRVAGSSVFERLMQDVQAPIKVFFFGGQGGVAKAACERMNERPSGTVCVGFDNPGFGSAEEMSSPATINRINASGADFVIVSLGAVKGQSWIMQNRLGLVAPVISHLGAVVNFIAGTVRRAPVWMQRCGFEWLWRIKEEPGLWRRYFRDGTLFFGLLLTKALPLAWCLSRHRPSQGELADATVDFDDGEQCVELRLRGAWCRENLSPLRRAFSNATRYGRDIRVDLSGVSHVDAAFLGLIMLLYGEQQRQQRSVNCCGMQDRVGRIFHYSCILHLFDDALP
jgi:N-acetylglucosaminyldiphosphoundecaprenol N-acetyl-beta-D-mannosaminyltransferase